MPDRPTPDRPIGRDTPKGQTNNALIISLVLAGVVAVLILGGATFFNSDEKSADATTTPPSTETPVPD
jgi:flagellar basal body-associated protein FliL